MHLYRSTRKDSPLSRHFLKAMVHFSVIRIVRPLRSASEILIAGLVGFKFTLDSVCMHVADDTEAPAAARDVDDAAPSVTAEFRCAATWAGSLDAARAVSASDLVILCHSLLLEASRRLSPSSSSTGSFWTAEIVKVLGFT